MSSRSKPRKLHGLTARLAGQRCWHIAEGAGPSFSLALGGGIARQRPIRSRNARFSRFHPEATVIVWCTWRLQTARRPLTSSDDTYPRLARILKRTLVGRRIRSVRVTPPCWDLSLTFEGGVTLSVFCDYVPGAPTHDGNWQIRVRSQIASVGPGVRIRTSESDFFAGEIQSVAPVKRRSRRSA